jgi:hypothetical protein
VTQAAAVRAEGERVHEVHETGDREVLDVGGHARELGVGEVERLPGDHVAERPPHPGVGVERHLEGERGEDAARETQAHAGAAQRHGHDALAAGGDRGESLLRHGPVAEGDEGRPVAPGEEAQLVVRACLVAAQQRPGEAARQEEDAQAASRRRTTMVAFSRRMESAPWSGER